MEVHDPKRLVSQGYDRIAERYTAWTQPLRVEERARYTRVLLDNLPEGVPVLELGCGAGIPTTRLLAERFAVTGVDISPRQIALARRRVPQATFLHADMTALILPPASFAAVAAFYSIIHAPREQHGPLLRSIATWLRPGGLFVGALGVSATEGGVMDDWAGLGAPMYFSTHDSATNEDLVRRAGLDILAAREEDDPDHGAFLWVVARKPRAQAASRPASRRPGLPIVPPGS
jgi:SAM-dependent methyltransferase